MPKHFHKKWTKWDYVNDIMDSLQLEDNQKLFILENNLKKMTFEALVILYEQVLILEKTQNKKGE